MNAQAAARKRFRLRGEARKALAKVQEAKALLSGFDSQRSVVHANIMLDAAIDAVQEIRNELTEHFAADAEALDLLPLPEVRKAVNRVRDDID